MEVLRRLRQTADMPVIFLTSKDEEIDELMGLNAGADDYIRKPFSQRLLLERVKAVLRRGGRQEGHAAARRARPSRAWCAASWRSIRMRHECTWDGKPVRLTVTEFLILQCLAQRPGFVKSRDNLMDAAYDDQVYVDDRTIDQPHQAPAEEVQGRRRRFRLDRNALWRRLPLQGELISAPSRPGLLAAAFGWYDRAIPLPEDR